MHEELLILDKTCKIYKQKIIKTNLMFVMGSIFYSISSENKSLLCLL